MDMDGRVPRLLLQLSSVSNFRSSDLLRIAHRAVLEWSNE